MHIMKKSFKRIMAAALACTLSIPAVFNSSDVSVAKAAKAPKLSTSKISSLEAGAAKKVTLKANGVKKIVRVTWKSNKKNISLSKKSKKGVTIRGVRAGKATLTANVKYRVKAKTKVISRKLTCKVTVTDAAKTTPAVTVTQTPAATTATASPVPDPTLSPTPSPTPGPANLLSALGKFVKNVGSCISYGGGWGGTPAIVADADTTAFIKENYNSLTAENEMKPESILGYQANTIKVEEARKQGFYIPAGYTESKVPVLNYDNIDTLCKYAMDNGLRIRYHGLLWHEQTSNWFFRKNYDGNAAYVTPEIMDERIDYYITNVMKHVYSSKYRDIVYCWDVVNEYHHMTECICRIQGTSSPLDPEGISKDKPETVKCFYEVYKDAIFEDPSDPAHSPVKTNPAYVKKAFMAAYKVLEEYGLTDSVELVYNDYDTNWPEVRATALAVTSYINTKDELNPNGDKLVTTIGMQTHDRLGDTRWSITSHEAAMEAFREAGMNFQVTEMDLNRNGRSDAEQLQYWSDFVALIIKEAKKGANITGFTWWGLYDSKSWLGTNGSPLLCGTSVKDKKPAYYKVISTAYEHYWD